MPIDLLSAQLKRSLARRSLYTLQSRLTCARDVGSVDSAGVRDTANSSVTSAASDPYNVHSRTIQTTSLSSHTDRLAAVPEHDSDAYGRIRDAEQPITDSAISQKHPRSPFFRAKRRSTSADAAASGSFSASGHDVDGVPHDVNRKLKPVIPACITVNRELELTKPQLLSNRRHLEAPLLKLVDDAIRPFVSEVDIESVSKSIAEMMVHVDQAETCESLVDVLARRLPVLDRIAAHWQSMAQVCPGFLNLTYDLPWMLTPIRASCA